MAHNRKLVIGGVALVKTRLKNALPAMTSVRSELEAVLIESGFFANAPFKWVGLIIRYGLVNQFEPEYQRINEAHGDLPIAIEIDVRSLVGADIGTVTDTFRGATIEALRHVAQRYGLPYAELEKYREGKRLAVTAMYEDNESAPSHGQKRS